MGFNEEIVKPRRKAYPWVWWRRDYNKDPWLGAESLGYSGPDNGASIVSGKGTVESFGTFSRSIANAMFGIEVPSFSLTLKDPTREWRTLAQSPYAALVGKWLQILTRVHDNQDDTYDGTVAVGNIYKPTFPEGAVTLQGAVATKEQFSTKLPRRLVSLNDWPRCPPENVGIPVPIIYGVVSNIITPSATEVAQFNCPWTGEGFLFADGFNDPMGLVGPFPDADTGLDAYADGWMIQTFDLLTGISSIQPLGPASTEAPYDGGYYWKSESPTAGFCKNSPNFTGRHGACGLYIRVDEALIANKGPLFTVRAGDPTDYNCPWLFTIWNTGAAGTDLEVLGEVDEVIPVGRPNGATATGERLGWQTPEMKACLTPGAWQFLEIRWRSSTISADAPTVRAADGFVEIRLDGTVICRLADMQTNAPLYLLGEVPTAPGDPISEPIYEEGTGSTWNTIGNSINVASTTSPRTGAEAIEGTDVGQGQSATGGVGPLNPTTEYDYLVLYIRSKGLWPANNELRLFFMAALDRYTIGDYVSLRDGLYGFDSSYTEDYQRVVIPTSAFNVATRAAGFRIFKYGYSEIGFWIDDISLVRGEVEDVEPTTGTVTIQYWNRVQWNPRGDAKCFYLTRGLYADWALELQQQQAPADDSGCANCDAETVGASSEGGGAIPCPLIDTQTYIGRVSSRFLRPTESDQDVLPPQDAELFLENIGTGKIPINTPVWYRISAVKNGIESALTDLLFGEDATNADSHKIVWNPAPAGADSYRIYQMLAPDIDVQGTGQGRDSLETYWVKTIDAATPNNLTYPEDNPRQFVVQFDAIGEGEPEQAFTEQTEYNYMVCGHAVKEVTEVWALETVEEAAAGSYDQTTGEYIPGTQTVKKLVKQVEGVDYGVKLWDQPGGIFTVLSFHKEMRDCKTCEFFPVSCNVKGIETNADGTGDLIDDGVQIVKHFLLNWIFNNYVRSVGVGGPSGNKWFTDVEGMPGLLDVASFDVASAVSRTFLAGGYIGAGALLEQVEARQLIEELIASFNLDFYYKNMMGNDRGAWAVRMFDPAGAPDPEVYEEEPDIVAGTFVTELNTDYQCNFFNYSAGPNLVAGVQKGWLISGELKDDTSIRLYGRIDKPFVLRWTRDAATAIDVTSRQLSFRRFPLVIGQFETKHRGIITDLASALDVTHKDGPGANPNGWENERVWTIGHDFDMDQMRVRIRFMALLGVAGIPNPWLTVQVFTARVTG